MNIQGLIERRERLMGPNVPTFYRKPVHITEGQGVWLWDPSGKRYLDCYNNVPHVGHCHPRVVEAIARQAAMLNTHSRYLHPAILDYIERLTARLNHGISQMIMACTGSEANDIALRMAQAVTGATGVIATDNTYHGNTAATSQLSTRRPPIGGRAPWVRLIPAPDRLLRPGVAPAEAARQFAAAFRAAIHELKSEGYGFSAIMLCPVFANEGLPPVPPGFLDPLMQVLRQEGGLMIADEVQPGFGRTGSHFWGHDRMGFAPDIVTMGKPMANGHPVAAVATRADIMAAFRENFGYFNTFGGNPVSAAACLATLDVIEEEELQENAERVGAYLLERLGELRHPLLSEVRGAGLFFALEFSEEGQPRGDFVGDLVEDLVARGILLNRLGRGQNIMKIRPPMPFGFEHADILADALQAALDHVPVAPMAAASAGR